jgi:hypothetical protein
MIKVLNINYVAVGVAADSVNNNLVEGDSVNNNSVEVDSVNSVEADSGAVSDSVAERKQHQVVEKTEETKYDQIQEEIRNQLKMQTQEENQANQLQQVQNVQDQVQNHGNSPIHLLKTVDGDYYDIDLDPHQIPRELGMMKYLEPTEFS